MEGKKAAEISTTALRWIVQNGLYILAVIVGIFIVLWLYRNLLGGGGGKKKTPAQVLQDFIDKNDIDGNPAATVIAATNIKNVAEDVFAMWSANNLFGTGCVTPLGISYDVSLSKILTMGLVQVNTLCEYWNATYKDQTATNVLGIQIVGSVSLLGAIENENSGFVSCLSNDIKTAVVNHLRKNGCQ